MRRGALVLLLLAMPGAAKDPPFFEPKDGFYKARGSKVIATWTLDRDEVPADGALTATLTIRGAANPHEIVRPDLAKVRNDEGELPFAERFQIEDVPGKPVPPDAKEAAFAYRLRPRNRDVAKVPNLAFWYDTGKKVGNPFQKTWAKGPKIAVTAATVPPKRQPIPLVEPDHLFDNVVGQHNLERDSGAFEWWSWLLLGAAGPLAAAGWYVGWRRLYPDAARLARIRRSRAVRRATDAIHRAGRAVDPAAAIAAAMLGYLRSRYPGLTGSETPGEVGEGLQTAGVPAHLVEAAVAFLRRCDEARFAPASDSGLSLAAGAEDLIAQLEAVE